MASTARALPSFDALYGAVAALPSGTTGEILERGVLHTMSRPRRAHRVAAQRALRGLDDFNGNVGGAGWWIEVEAEVRLLDEYLVVPDLAGWRVERVAEMPDENPIDVVPDWACEILSPTTMRDDRRLKLPLYARAGIDWIWLLDTDARQIEVYETVDERATFVLLAAESAVLPPFDRAFDVASWFAAAAIAKPRSPTHSLATKRVTSKKKSSRRR